MAKFLREKREQDMKISKKGTMTIVGIFSEIREVHVACFNNC